ncbi:MAG TPA: AAA-like domain-containing protein [Woeseiaceae bacterium]|nr:AAA-like domain-containing protein [Woeseiaceae bacterium]
MSTRSDGQKPRKERSRGDSSGEFFSVGPPLHAVRAGYVRRRADDLLFDAVLAGRYAHVIAPCRSGKTSLVAATAARLEAKGFRVAILDLGQIGERDAGTDAGRWYYSVAYRILRQLRIRFDLQSWWQEKSVLGNCQRLLEFYNEIVLRFVKERIVIFVDEVQCIGENSIGTELLVSIRSAHNGRAMDPEFARLTFVLLGECDPSSLIDEPALSPFTVTQAIPLDDFTRDDLNIFATELNLSAEQARQALDRIHYWTNGQPYLTQKLARAISREQVDGDVDAHVDDLVRQQFIGRAALRTEPHLSHIHREVMCNGKQSEALLNLYGRFRKGVPVDTDRGSPLQRRLMAIGLLTVDSDGELQVRNRIYESVFTARWANENLPTRLRAPLTALAVIFLVMAVPFVYTQWLPLVYVGTLTSPTAELESAETAWRNLRSFPGHAGTADNLYRNFLQTRGARADDVGVIEALAELAAELPQAGQLPDELRAAYWDRRVRAATRNEQRDPALIAALESLVLSTQERRHRAAMLIGDDYPLLIASLPAAEAAGVVFDPGNQLLTTTQGSKVRQWSLVPQGLQPSGEWTITALEVLPLVRRVMVDRNGTVNRVSLTLNITHPRLSDLRVKIIAPSGRAVEIETGIERASSVEDIRIPASHLQDLVGEPMNGTWSLSVRDEEIGVAGHLVGWNLTLNSQGLVEDFQRGLHIPDPAERDTDNIWIGPEGRYAVARALQSDSARVWDLAFAKPIRAVAVNQNEKIVGLDNGARRLVTATVESVNVWATATGDRIQSMKVGAASLNSQLTGDGLHLFAETRSDTDTRLELWSLETGQVQGRLDIAGTPALVALDASGARIAVADFDQAVRIWDFQSGEMLAQIDLPLQPSAISLDAGGDVLGVIYGDSGASLWRVERPGLPLLDERGKGRWRLAFSSSGSSVAIGRPRSGYQVYRTDNGQQAGPLLGSGGSDEASHLLAFSADERVLLTGGPDSAARFWRVPADIVPVATANSEASHAVWTATGNAVVAATPDAGNLVIGDDGGHVHVLPADVSAESLAAAAEEVSFVGHDAAVRMLRISADGRLAASAAADDTVRVWDLADGRPLPFMTDMPGGTVTALEFSPDASTLAAVNATRVVLLDTGSGDVLVELPLGEVHAGVAFADDDNLYLGSRSGSLSVVSRSASGAWTQQLRWQGAFAIKWLRASPRGRRLVLVDQNNLAQQFDLEEGRIGALSVSLPSSVEDVAFNPVGSRAYFRTARWIHRASSSTNGLIWLDAIFGPRPANGAGIVVNTPTSAGNEIKLPVIRAGSVTVAQLRLDSSETPGLFGNRDELIEEWRRRLGMATEGRWGTAVTAAASGSPGGDEKP